MAQSCPPKKKKKEDLNLNSFLHEMRDGSTGKDLPLSLMTLISHGKMNKALTSIHYSHAHIIDE